jgi:hypothetical protein
MKTNTIFQTYGKPAAIESYCVSIAFHRPLGTNPFQVNGMPVEDGATFTISQNVGDLDTTKYQLTFQAGQGVNECHVIRIVPVDLKAYCG